MNMKITLLTAGAAIIFAATTIQAEDAKAVYEKSCAMCHGKDGTGDTAMGKKLQIKNYTDAKVQEAIKDEDMIKAIKEGVKEGDKTKMKAFDKLTDDEAKALVAYIRAFKK